MQLTCSSKTPQQWGNPPLSKKHWSITTVAWILRAFVLQLSYEHRYWTYYFLSSEPFLGCRSQEDWCWEKCSIYYRTSAWFWKWWRNTMALWALSKSLASGCLTSFSERPSWEIKSALVAGAEITGNEYSSRQAARYLWQICLWYSPQAAGN